MHAGWTRRARCWLPVLLLAIGATGACAARSPGVPPVRDTVWYVSARARDDAGRDRRAITEALEYGAAIFERAAVRDPSADHLSFALRDSLRFSRDAFLEAIRVRAASQRAPDDFAVLYVHGFGTGLDECWTHPVHARTRSRSTAPWIAFCWPSHGSGITWPRPGSVFVRAYEEDTASVTTSAPAFRRVLDDVTGTLGASRVLVATHSLGGRLASEELARPASGPASPDTLRALALLALDHDAARFADTLLPALRPHAHRVVLYTARRDRALTISRRMHDAPRAGLAEPASLVRDGLETVDVSDAFVTDGWFQRLVGNRHSIRRASGLLWDLAHIVGRGLAPSCRDTLGSGRREPDGAWRLQRVPHPDTTRLLHCPSFTATPVPARTTSPSAP
jgi:hypothetical protein